MYAVDRDELPLERAYRWERERAHDVFLTQPFNRGQLRSWTWAQTLAEARRVAAWLKAQGWEPGTRVAILSRNSAWWIMADLAIWMAGYASVPVYPSLRGESVRRILEHSGARAVFLGATDEREHAALGIPESSAVVYLPTAHDAGQPSWDALVAAHEPLAESPTRPANDLATIIYTSGTTGAPKGVMHSFQAFAYFARVAQARLMLRTDERALSYLPLAHIVERAGIEGLAIYLGWRLYFSEGLETFLTDLQRARPTIFLSVPRLLLKFQQGVYEKIPKKKLDRLLHIPLLNRVVRRKALRGLGLDTVRQAACGAAPLPPEILKWYRGLGLNLAEGYGMTETVITHLPRQGEVRPGYVGSALDGIEDRIGPDGELFIRSPMNMLGYYRDPQATREAFTEDGFFRTGDLAQKDADGQIRIVGRVKEQFKTSKGKYVAPAPIESELMAHPAVEAACLMGAGQPNPFAVILLSPEAKKAASGDERQALANSLRARLDAVNGRLDPHERVSFIAIVDGPWNIENGLMTPTLKLRRAALENLYQPMVEKWKAEGGPVIWEAGASPQARGAGQTQPQA